MVPPLLLPTTSVPHPHLLAIASVVHLSHLTSVDHLLPSAFAADSRVDSEATQLVTDLATAPRATTVATVATHSVADPATVPRATTVATVATHSDVAPATVPRATMVDPVDSVETVASDPAT